MFRAAVLIAIALLSAGGCAKEPPMASIRAGCVSCHEAHHVEAGACESCHRGDPNAAREAIAHQRLLAGRAAAHRLAGSAAVREGERLIGQLACRRCHVIDREGNRLATSLDRAVWEREQRELELSIRRPVEGMPRFALSELQTGSVIASLLRHAEREGADPGYQVRFENRGNADSPFARHCGGCHRALLLDGPAGRGSGGPNLSGLFTLHYPACAEKNRPWDEALLGDWLENPRAIRPATTMRPVKLDPGERLELVMELRGSGPAPNRK
ncbi:MAG: selenite/tellurite reduction operon c-type cytochrome lipoprotein ExtS [Thermoanaerobaculia bacterium]